jgi:hypothetical protein
MISSGGDFTHTVCKYLVRYHVLVFVVLTLLLVYLHCSISLSCPAIQCMQCSLHVSLEMVRALLSAEPTLTKYHSLALAEFVQSHKLLRWCPGPNCSIVFKVRERLPKRVACSNCTFTCCFQCGEAYHLPADCECYRRWLLKCQDDSETANYILANTKDVSHSSRQR